MADDPWACEECGRSPPAVSFPVVADDADTICRECREDVDDEVVAEYPHNCRIVREQRDDAPDRYHYEGPMGRVKSFENPDKARLYADVQEVTGGFREEKTGERGVPPAVARAREDVLMAYLVSNETMGTEWVARFYDVEEDLVRDYVRMVRERAEEMREEEQG